MFYSISDKERPMFSLYFGRFDNIIEKVEGMNMGVNVDVRVHFSPISIHKNSLLFAYLFKTTVLK